MTVLTDKPKVGRTDATLLVEELNEIYSTPTPNGWRWENVGLYKKGKIRVQVILS